MNIQLSRHFCCQYTIALRLELRCRPSLSTDQDAQDPATKAELSGRAMKHLCRNKGHCVSVKARDPKLAQVLLFGNLSTGQD